jgi:ferredoxin
MEGNGPSGGNPRETGYIFAAENPHALDRALCAFINMPESYVATVTDALERGLCSNNIEYLCDGKPEPITDYKFPDSKPLAFHSLMPKFVGRLFTPIPVIRPKDCIGCEKCAESCSPDAIEMQTNKAVIKYEKCIKCFCCHEMCPAKAIDIKRSRLLRW